MSDALLFLALSALLENTRERGKTSGQLPVREALLPAYVFVNDIGSQFLIRIGARDFLNVSLLLKFGGPMTKKKGATWLLLMKKGATSGLSAPIHAPTEPPQRFPQRSLPYQCRASPRFCCLSNVCRHPPPRSRLPVRVAHPEPRHVKAAQEAGGLGGGALVLALTGVAHLSSRTGGFYPLLVPGTESTRAGSELSTGCPCRSACCNR